MNKIVFITFIIIISIVLFGFPREIQAHCPLCVAGAGVGLTLSRLLGIDDSITGVWLGAFLGAMAFWTQRLLASKNKNFSSTFFGIFIYLGIFAATIWSFYKYNLILKHGDIFGLDKLTFGMVIGGSLFYIVDIVNGIIIMRHGRSLFPYQRLVTGLGSMFLLSGAVFILINYYI